MEDAIHSLLHVDVLLPIVLPTPTGAVSISCHHTSCNLLMDLSTACAWSARLEEGLTLQPCPPSCMLLPAASQATHPAVCCCQMPQYKPHTCCQMPQYKPHTWLCAAASPAQKVARIITLHF
eukprot:1134220-Pelagomonas_calceolata.AAC.3